MSIQARASDGRLAVSDIMSRNFVAVPLGTTLPEVLETLSQSRFQNVLVTDALGCLVGMLSACDILRHMQPRQEACTYALDGTCVESAMVTTFISSAPDAASDDLAIIMVNGSLACLPVLQDGKPIGIVTPADLLSNGSQPRTLAHQLGSDPLTGIANRASFEQRLVEELERAHRQHTCLGLILFDVDDFEMITNTAGHPAGDAVLRMVGACLRRNLRKYDAIGRYGRDEFAAVCFGCGQAQIESLVQRVQGEVSAVAVTSRLNQRPVTLSVGAAVLPIGFSGIEPGQLLQAAERCLQQAIASGGDCARGVECAASVTHNTLVSMAAAV